MTPSPPAPSLVQPRRLLAAVIDGLERRLLVVDSERRVVLANRPFLEASGRSLDSVVGRPCERLCGGNSPCLVDAAFSGEDQRQIVEESATDAEASRWIERSATAVRDEDGNILYVVESRRDITAERRLAQAGKESRAFCHEINNPLFVALGTLELMAEDAPRESPQTREFEVVLRNLRRIGELTRERREKIAAAERQEWYGQGRE